MRLKPEQVLDRLQPQGKRKAKGQDALRPIATFGDADDNIFVFGNSQGGVMTTALDTLPTIIGTWEGDCGDIPPALQDMLTEYANEVEWFERVGEGMEAPSTETSKAPKAPRQSIPAMIETKWSQSSPYNDTIVFDGIKCPTGCNTTAVAQLMYHWWKEGYSRGCPPTKEYKTESNGWNVPASPSVIVFDFKHMTKTKPKAEDAKKAVQELMFQLGKLFKSDFKPKSTSAYPKTVAACLKDDLKMGGFISYIYASKLGTAKFENFIYNELLQERPVMMAGWTGNGGGHSFLVDGYDVENDMYHVNWGWGGSYNGWFKLSALNPTTTVAYNSNKTAIIGIKPDYKLGDANGDGDIDVADATQIIQAIQKGDNDARYDINSDGKVTVTDAQLIIDKILGKIEL